MLKLLQPGIQPIGQYDGYDSEVLTLQGGEIVTLISVVAPNPPGTDLAAADAFDGYVNIGSVQHRPVVTRNVATTARPLFLADEGTTGYGTLFGSVVGGTLGQQVTGGTVLGPHTATGSGKVTLWDKPGLYAVSLDACDKAADGLVPTNVTLNTGSTLTFIPLSSTVGGKLTPVGSAAAAGNSVVVARLVDFESNGSLVTTPNRLVAALNSPSGNVSSVGPRQFAFATFYFQPPTL